MLLHGFDSSALEFRRLLPLLKQQGTEAGSRERRDVESRKEEKSKKKEHEHNRLIMIYNHNKYDILVFR